jgi:hypothetical protein
LFTKTFGKTDCALLYPSVKDLSPVVSSVSFTTHESRRNYGLPNTLIGNSTGIREFLIALLLPFTGLAQHFLLGTFIIIATESYVAVNWKLSLNLVRQVFADFFTHTWYLSNTSK